MKETHSMKTHHLLVERYSDIVLFTLNCPEQRNALSRTLLLASRPKKALMRF